MAMTHIFSFLSFWLLQPPSSGLRPPAMPQWSPQSMSSVCCSVLYTPCGFHDMFPSLPALALMLADWVPSEGTWILHSVGSLPGDHSCLCLWFLSWSSWCEPERGGIMPSSLFWDMRGSQSRTRWLVYFLFIFRCTAPLFNTEIWAYEDR